MGNKRLPCAASLGACALLAGRQAYRLFFVMEVSTLAKSLGQLNLD
jgi:hypothetical protein